MGRRPRPVDLMGDVELRDLTATDRTRVEDLVARTLGDRRQVRLGEVVDVLTGHGVGAWSGDALVGVVTWDPTAPLAELVSLAVTPERRGEGVGGRLVEAASVAASAAGAEVLWLVTTNDNLEALVLYLRHGFRIVSVRPGAVDEARRTLKPQIPLTGSHGIPMRDELVLEREL